MQSQNTERRRIRDRLDERLPIEIDRRKFLATAAAGVFTTPVAGCLGGDGSNVGDATFRQPWLATPVWSYAHMAVEEGFWEDQGIQPPEVENGENSPDTIRRVGTGEEEIGHGDWASTTDGLAEGYDLRMIGNTRNRMILSFFWVEDELDGHDDLEGADVALASPFAEVTWPVYPHVVGVDPDVVSSAEFAEQEVVTGMLDSGDVNAVWASLQQLAVYERELNLDFGVMPLGGLVDIYGYPLFANGEWIEDEENFEYTVSVLEGYSQAQRWAMLNPEETLDIMVEEVNPELGAQDRDALEDEMRVGVTLAMGEEVRQNGLGHIDVDKVQNTLDTVSEALVENPSDVPNADDIVATDVQEDADLATFDDDEYAELESYTGRWNEFFE